MVTLQSIFRTKILKSVCNANLYKCKDLFESYAIGNLIFVTYCCVHFNNSTAKSMPVS